MILLFWFLLIALALAWGIADHQQEELARRPPPATPPAKTAPAPPTDETEAPPVREAERSDESR